MGDRLNTQTEALAGQSTQEKRSHRPTLQEEGRMTAKGKSSHADEIEYYPSSIIDNLLLAFPGPGHTITFNDLWRLGQGALPGLDTTDKPDFCHRLFDQLQAAENLSLVDVARYSDNRIRHVLLTPAGWDCANALRRNMARRGLDKGPGKGGEAS